MCHEIRNVTELHLEIVHVCASRLMKNDVGMHDHVPLTVFFPLTLGEPKGKSKGVGGQGVHGAMSSGFAGTQIGFTHVVPQAIPPKRNPLPQICMSVCKCLRVHVCTRVCRHLCESSDDERF